MIPTAIAHEVFNFFRFIKFRWNQVGKFGIKKVEHSDSQEVFYMKVHPRIEIRPDVMFGKPVKKIPALLLNTYYENWPVA